MNKTISFVSLDFKSLKPYKKVLYSYIAMVIFLGVANDSLSALFFMVMFGVMAILSYPFVISEKNNLDILYSTLSLERKNIVIGRYIFPLIIETTAVVLLLLFANIKSNFAPIDMTTNEMLINLSFSAMFLSVIISFQYPAFFKMGYTKARLFNYVPLLLVFVFLGILQLLVDKLNIDINWIGINQFFEGHLTLMIVLSIIIGIISLVISCMISIKIYDKKDI